MAKIALDLSQFKSAGVYTVEIDQSERITVNTQSLRLVPGFAAQGPYNSPVFIRNTRDLQSFYGPLDTKLERKGSFFHRSIQTCLLSSPVFAINLLNVNTQNNAANTDKVDLAVLSVDTSNNKGVFSDHYFKFFNRERFWKPDEDYFQGIVNNKTLASSNINAPLLSIANVGTKTMSLIVRKASGVQGYAVPAKDWYGSAVNIPYKWIRENDLISDYFIQILSIEGDWSDASALSADPYYSQYFNIKGLIPTQVSNFINANQVNLLGSWTGTFIPDFKDQTGSEQYIESIVNGSTSITGLFVNVNQDALDQLIWDSSSAQWELGDGSATSAAPYLVDLVGHNMINSVTGAKLNFLSYDVSVANNVLHKDVSIAGYSDGLVTGKKFIIKNPSDNLNVYVGAYVKSGATIPGVTRITNKFTLADTSIVFETAEKINGGGAATTMILQKTIEDPSINTAYKMIPLRGLSILNRHTPGFDEAGAANAEAGVTKIYEMLHDSGILRGLTNPDMINYRYIVDTMANGLAANMGGKAYLSSLAKKRGKCTAILNAPSIKQFSSSQNPYFADTFVSGVDPIPVFNTQYIPMGGNSDMPKSYSFSLPNEELGSKFAGVFGPFLTYNENGKLISVPPAADVCNAYARKYLGGNPYAIVANRNGILSNPNLAGVEYKIDKQDRDYLEPFGYNSIIERPTTGQIMIYSNQTAFQTVKSDFNNLHVRELLNTIESQIDEVLQNYVFRFNNTLTRLNIINSITPILETAKDAGAISKYDLVMDDTNNSASVIADGFGIVDIGLWITGALTKIVARYTVNSNAALGSGA